jgi:hypothetical protein
LIAAMAMDPSLARPESAGLDFRDFSPRGKHFQLMVNSPLIGAGFSLTPDVTGQFLPGGSEKSNGAPQPI